MKRIAAMQHHFAAGATPMSKDGVSDTPVASLTAVLDPPVRTPQQRRRPAAPAPGIAPRFTAAHPEDDASNRQAELFYLQKQIQLQTPMVFILEDGQRIQGIIEWYDRLSIKVRGKSRSLLYKSAIKYLYKAGEVGMAPAK
jgi:sRNA-binding regulator protein Hfq